MLPFISKVLDEAICEHYLANSTKPTEHLSDFVRIRVTVLTYCKLFSTNMGSST